MDVHCTTCGEPWDVYHLLHEAIHDTALSRAEIEEWRIQTDRLRSPYREAFREARWEFGRTLVNVIRCPWCPPNAQPDPGRLQTKAALEELLGADIDGLAATYEDYHL